MGCWAGVANNLLSGRVGGLANGVREAVFHFLPLWVSQLESPETAKSAQVIMI